MMKNKIKHKNNEKFFNPNLLRGVLLLVFAGQAFSATQTLRPDATGTYQQWNTFGAGNAHYDRVADQSDATGVQVAEDEISKETENLSDLTFSSSVIINSVTVYFRAVAAGTKGPERAVVIWRTYNTDYESAKIAISRTAFTDYSDTAMTTNPNTGVAWTKDEITALEVGIRAQTLDLGESIQCSEIWIVVDYTPILSISATPTNWAVGTVDAAITQLSNSGNKIEITNDGGATETFMLQVFDEDDRNEWTASTSEGGAGTNVYVFSGIFCATTDAPTSGSFNEGASDDVVTTTLQAATITTYGYAGGSSDGVSVPAGETRSLWLKFDLPTGVSGTYYDQEHTIIIRIGCQW